MICGHTWSAVGDLVTCYYLRDASHVWSPRCMIYSIPQRYFSVYEVTLSIVDIIRAKGASNVPGPPRKTAPCGLCIYDILI